MVKQHWSLLLTVLVLGIFSYALYTGEMLADTKATLLLYCGWLILLLTDIDNLAKYYEGV